MQWTHERTEEIKKLLAGMDERRSGYIDAMVLQLFCQLHMYELMPPAFAKVATQLTEDEYAKLVSMFLTLEAVSKSAQALMSNPAPSATDEEDRT